MADETTTSTTSDQQLSQIINQLLSGKTAQPAVDPNTGPSSRDGRTILSLLGEGLGGGSQYGSTTEREQGGLSALGALGSRMLQASDWSATPHTFGSILGQGLDAARGNLGQTQAVSAARQYATQQLAHQQQEDQINRLKEALPYLQLQEDQRAAARMRGLLGGNTSIGAAGDGTYAGAIGGHEGTGQNPGSSAVGTGQFLRDTWLDFARANPQYFQGMSEKQILDSRTVPEFSKKVGPVAIEWLAKQNADALTNAGVPPSGPVLGIAHYVGAGAAANIAKAPDSTPVARFVGQAALDANPELRTMTVGQMKARYANTPNPSFMSAPAPGQAGAPTPASLTPSAPGAKTQIPPPTVTAPGQATPATPGQATMPPPEPPLLAGTAQTAGDVGAPTGTVIPPSPAGSDATVAEIEAGRASSPARTGAQPGAVVTAQAGGQQPSASQFPPIPLAGGVVVAHPGSSAEFHAREYVPPPQTEDFNPNLTLAQQAAFASEAKAIEQRALAVSAMRKPDEKSVQDILAAREELKAKVQTAAQEKAQKAAIAKSAYDKEQFTRIDARYEKERTNYDAAATEVQRQTNARQTAKEAAEYTANQSEVTSRIAMRDKLLTELDGETRSSTEALSQLTALRDLSRAAGPRSLVPAGARDWLVRTGIATPDQAAQWSAQQALDAANNRMIGAMRNGTGFSRTTNMDLEFLTHAMPGGSETNEDYRNAKQAFLISAFRHQQQYAREVRKGVSAGMNYPDAEEAADKKMGPVIKQDPADRTGGDLTNWRFDNLENGQFYKDASGRLRIFNPKGAPRPE